MKTRFHQKLGIAVLSATTWYAGANFASAADYAFGGTTSTFTLAATDQARSLGGSSSFNNNSGDMGVYWRGSASDATYVHFDLSIFTGATILGDVNVNFTANAQYGGSISNGVLSTANTAWTFPGGAPAYTAVSGTSALNGNYATGQAVTWNVTNATFSSYVSNPSSFNGFVVSAGSGSTLHFSGTPTLTGTIQSALINVTGGTDWTSAVWNEASSTLQVSGSNTVTGGSVVVRASSSLAVTDSATMGSGSFAGTFSNAGTLSFGSSANQALSGTISGAGNLVKSGAGNLTLSGNNTFSGGTTINGGSVTASYNTLGSGPVTINNGGTLNTSGQWVFGGTNPWGVSTRQVSSVTVNSGGTLSLSADGFAIGITNLYLNGGSVTGGNNNAGLGDLFLHNGNQQITADGSTTSTIGVRVGLNGSNNSITVNSGSNLNITSTVANTSSWGNNGGFIKSGSGTLTLSGTNSYGGTTAVNGGKLVIDGNNSGATGAVTVASGAILGGSGTVGGATTIQSGGRLAVGNSPGTQTFNSSLTFASGSIFDWELNAPTANTGTSNQGTYDKVVANGAVTGTAVFTIALGTNAFTDTFWTSNKTWSDIFTGTGSYDLATVFSSFAGAGVDSSGVVSGHGQFSFTGNTLTWTAVPEPTTGLAGLLLGAGLLRRRRK